MLRDLTVQNYRCFENFHIDGLEQVNLFVGNNNSGKTSLLEAIYLLVANNKYESLLEILLNRREIIIEHAVSKLPRNKNIKTNFHHIESIDCLFYNYKLNEKQEINVAGSNKNQENNNSKITTSIYYLQEEDKLSSLVIADKDEQHSTSKAFKIKETNNTLLIKKLTDSIEYQESAKFVVNSMKDLESMQVIWDDIYLTTKEDKVVKAVQIIENKIERIGFYNHQLYSIVKFKIRGYDHPIALSSMGEGMYQILKLAMSLVTAENGVLLVDEIETGLHYKAQIDMWSLILETAKELNVQVFATTHSWDCIAAFQEALSQVEDKSVGKLFRLDSKYGKLRAVEYNAEDLGVAVRESIEVR